MGQVIEYEAPQSSVCGVFLCQGVAGEVSVWTGGITQEAWSDTYTTIGTSVSDAEDIWIEI
jgi:hypothetical protein